MNKSCSSLRTRVISFPSITISISCKNSRVSSPFGVPLGVLHLTVNIKYNDNNNKNNGNNKRVTK